MMPTCPAVTFSVLTHKPQLNGVLLSEKQEENKQTKKKDDQWRNGGNQLFDFGLFQSALSVLDISGRVKAWNS